MIKKKTMWELLHENPTMTHPIQCDNGCGAVIELGDAFRSYKNGEDGLCLLICECCASEEGHKDEASEEPEDSPICKRRTQ